MTVNIRIYLMTVLEIAPDRAVYIFVECEKHHMVSVVLIRSPVDGRLFLAYPHDPGALSQSFDKLQLLDDGGSHLVSVICFYL